MKRRFLALGGVLLMVLSLSSCIAIGRPRPQQQNKLIGHSLDYIYNEDDYLRVKEGFEKLPLMLETEGQFEKIYDRYLDLDAYVSEIATYSNIEYLKTSIKQNDESNDLYLKFNSKLTTLIDLEKDFLRKASKSSYKDSFFPNMSDEEINDSLGITYPDRFYTLDGEVERILVEYRKLSIDEKKTKAAEMYSEIVSKYNEMSKLAGYNDYLDYAYENVYDRDYMPIDSISFSNNVKEYIMPELLEAKEATSNIEDRLSNSHKKYFVDLVQAPFAKEKSLLDSYAKYMGGAFYLSYQALWDDGYYYFSNDSKAIDGAYTTYLPSLKTPAVYFGPNYQNIMTVCHEFGHYFSYIRNDGRGGSFDLAETQSQGNELLFLSFIEQKSSFEKEITEAFRDYQLNNYLSTILMATIVNDFEYRVYKENITDPALYDSIFKEVCEKFASYDELSEIFGINPADYWKMVALDNAGYYISYAVSLVPSIEIYTMATNDIAKAKDSFYKLTNKVYVDDSYEITLNNANLISPFKKEAYLEIPNLF